MKLLRVWNDMRVSDKWQNFHFGVEYPFKTDLNVGLFVQARVSD